MMAESISCPKCGELVDPHQSSCDYCGVSLALAALLAERELTMGSILGDNIPISPEILVPLLGNYLIEREVLSPSDLEEALSYQAKLANDGKTPLIGQALLDLGLVTKETLDQAITEQIIELQFALEKANSELEDRVRERTDELKNALNRLTELNRLKSNFIANISHELRTPLTHIRGYLELLIGNEFGPLSEEQLKALDVMRKSEERLEKLIENLIQYSLVARGALDLYITRVNIHHVLDEVVPEAFQKCKKANIVFKTSNPEIIPEVDADHRKIVWVLSQLVDNAIKFTPDRGIVELNVHVGKNLVSLSIYDNGIGIEPEKFTEIFEPFHQLDGSATRRYGGTGLGLSMVKQIIEAHNSTIRVKSKLGSGSFFGFSLPIGKEWKS
jgi:signal transduction histidine kinase